MSQHLAASFLYLLITAMFSLNLKDLYLKHREGRISSPTILATISLVVSFAALTIYFASDHVWIVLIAQAYLLLTMVYIKFFAKKK